jgi:glutaminyl-tRNA synthetase
MQLFKSASPADCEDWLADMDADSEEVLSKAFVCERLARAEVGERFQLERLGYFCVDKDSDAARRVFNRTCTLRDTYAGKRT